MRCTPYVLAVLLLGWAIQSAAGTIEIVTGRVTEWKSVYGQVETRDRVPARARIGGTISSLLVSEGDFIDAGERVAVIEDTKLEFQIDGLNARLKALEAQLSTARSELDRGEQLLQRGVITTQRLEVLQTAVDVIVQEVSNVEAQRQLVEQQITEGEVLAPGAGIILSVPVSLGSVINPGEAIAIVGGGGVFLRLAVPERHAGDLAEGDRIEIGDGDGISAGVLDKLYPQIEGGRVQADVIVEDLDSSFIGRRVPVRLPVGERDAILVPQTALSRSGGLDFVKVETASGPLGRVVVPGAEVIRHGVPWREILTGLVVGDVVMVSDE